MQEQVLTYSDYHTRTTFPSPGAAAWPSQEELLLCYWKGIIIKDGSPEFLISFLQAVRKNPHALSELYLHKGFPKYHFFNQEDRVIQKQTLAKPDYHEDTHHTPAHPGDSGPEEGPALQD